MDGRDSVILTAPQRHAKSVWRALADADRWIVVRATRAAALDAMDDAVANMRMHDPAATEQRLS